MGFSSPLFLFLFLPCVVAAYFGVPRRARNGCLLAASLAFYGWGETRFCVVVVASIMLNFGLALAIERQRARPTGRWALPAAVAANVGLLAVYKYAGFFADSLGWLSETVGGWPVVLPSIALPIGISFITFQSLSYVLDVARGTTRAQRNPLHLALYILLFPQLIAGPIVRYAHFAPQITARRESLAEFALGVRRFIVGLGKKVLIANRLAVPADAIFALPADELTLGLSWLAIACYSLQIYFDFSGYSDMAIGLGRMFGFHIPENFAYPYASRSLREFWQRWHISLSTWFRDYLYVPLGGNRRAALRVHLNLVLVFTLCGLWHGARWGFVVWGLYHGVFLILERGAFGRLLARAWPPLRHGYLVLVVMTGWVLFRTEHLSDAGAFLAAMAGFGAGRGATYHPGLYMDVTLVGVAIAGTIGALPLLPALRRWLEAPGVRWPGQVTELAGAGVLTVILAASCMALAADTYNPFIYFRF